MKFSWELQPFDTDLFGFSVAKITSLASVRDIPYLIEDLQYKQMDYATYRLSANNFSIIHGLEEYGFLLVDGTIALSLNFFKESKVSPHIRKAEEKDSTKLMEIARNVFSQTRFYTDPLIPKEKADELYARWIENSLLSNTADQVLIWEEKEIQGFITLQKTGHITLVAVAQQSQGKGIARKLIEATFPEFRKWGVTTVTIETQMTNIPALRSYQSCGFKIVESFLTFRWSNPVGN